jgi:hypothetical protein
MRVAPKHGLTEHSDDLLGRVAIRRFASKGPLVLGFRVVVRPLLGLFLSKLERFSPPLVLRSRVERPIHLVEDGQNYGQVFR